MKAHKVHSCKDCFPFFQHHGFCVYPEGPNEGRWCDMTKVPADCPLPDWPRVSREFLRDVCKEIRGGNMNVEALGTILRSIGVEVVDEGKEG